MKKFLLSAVAGMSAASVFAAAPVADAVSEALAQPQWRCAKYSLAYTVYDHYYGKLVLKDKAADAAWEALKTPAEVAAHGKRMRDAMVSAIGGFPERCPLNVSVKETVKRDGYTLEKIVFESRPKFYVTAHRFVPDPAKFKAPYPGVIVPCGHSRSGKLAPWYQRPGVLGAKNGFMTIVYDPVDQGERSQMRPFTNQTWSTTREHNRIGMRAVMIGWNTAQFRIYDGMRAIDVLTEDPRVDASKIGVFGISGGGTLTSYIMALDDRVRAACPAGYLTTMRALCDRCGPQDAEQNIFGQLAFGLNHLGYVLMRAPSPVLLNCTHSDFFPYGGSLETAALAEKTFAKIGASSEFGLFDVPGPHHWYESQQVAGLVWMKDRFGLTKDAFPAGEEGFKRLDVGFSYEAVDVGLADNANPQRHVSEAGKVTSRGYVLDLPGARSVYDIMRDEKIRTAVQDGGLSPALVRKTAGFRSRDALVWEAGDVREKTVDGLTVRTSPIILPGMLRIPTVTFIPENAKGRPALIVSDSKRDPLAGKVRSLLAEGRPVMVAELRAFGETGVLRRERKNRGFYGCLDADEEMSMMCYLLGESLVGHRTEDLLCAASSLSSLTGGKKIDLYCEGRAVIPAAHAFYAEREFFGSFNTERSPESWAGILAAPEKPYRFANTVHGALRLYDWTDLVQGAE